MPDRISESDLLAFVEDSLDAEAMAVLQEQLAVDPPLRATLDALARDRAVLRSLEEPALPRDFIPALEAHLLRPMLIENQPPRSQDAGQPGAYRRRHRATSRPTRLARYAVAAIVLLSVTAAAWMSFNFGLPDFGSESVAELGPGETAAPGGATVTDNSAVALASTNEDDLEPGDQVHHFGPLPRMAVADRQGQDGGTGGHRLPASPNPLLTASLVLVLVHDDVAAGEAVLRNAVAGLGAAAQDGISSALVQNFSMDEARRLETKYFPGAPRNPAPVAVTGIDRNAQEQRRLAGVLDTLRRRPSSGGDEKLVESRLLCGSPEIAPNYQRQLELSGRGATHTIAIPVHALGDLLGRLHRIDGPSAVLRPLDVDGNVPELGPVAAGDGIDAWIAERREIDAFLTQLRARDADGTVLHVPVVLRTR